MELAQARILLIGASGVIGGRLAERLTAAGASLVVTGRDTERLARVAERTGAASVVLDVLDTEAVAGAVDEAADRLGGLDALVVTSGVAGFGSAVDDDDAIVEELFAVNALGPMAAVRAAIPRLSEGGAIAVVTAILADHPTAGMAAYSASKSAISAYLAAVRRELRKQRITVLDVRPPHIDTGLADRALAGTPPRMPPGHDLDEVVEAIVTGLAEGKTELVADPKARTLELR